MEMTSQEKDVWTAVGKGLSHQIFDRFERFEDAIDEVLSDFNAEGLTVLRGLLERMLDSNEDIRALWESSGAGVAFKDSRGARMTMDMLREAVVAKQGGLT